MAQSKVDLPICPPRSIRRFDKVVVPRQLKQPVPIPCASRNILATGTRVFVAQYFSFDRPFPGEFPNHRALVRNMTRIGAVVIKNDLADLVFVHMPPMTDEAIVTCRIGQDEGRREKRRRNHNRASAVCLHP